MRERDLQGDARRGVARAGVHTGECEVIGDDLSGIAVHIAARLTEAAAPSEVLVSRTAREAVTGSNISFDDRGKHTFRGVPGEWDAYAVSADAGSTAVLNSAGSQSLAANT